MTKKILVIGIGSIGRRHIRNIKFLFPNSIISLLSKSSNGTYDEEKLVHNIFRKTSDALTFSFDAIFICGPASSHIKASLDFLKKGNNIFIEKPLSDNFVNCNNFLNYAKFSKNIIQIGYQFKFHPSLIKLRNEIKTRKYGNLVSSKIECSSYLPKWREGRDYSKTVSASKQLGGGVILELSHEIDYISWIFGDYKWVKAHVSKQSSLEIDVEDNANIVFGIESDRDNEIVVSLNMDFIRHDNIRQCIAIGEKGSLRWDGIKGEVAWFSKVSKEWKVIFSQFTKQDYTYEKEIDSFFSAVEKEEVVPVTGEDGLKTVRTIDAIHQSHRNNAMVTL